MCSKLKTFGAAAIIRLSVDAILQVVQPRCRDTSKIFTAYFKYLPCTAYFKNSLCTYEEKSTKFKVVIVTNEISFMLA